MYVCMSHIHLFHTFLSCVPDQVDTYVYSLETPNADEQNGEVNLSACGCMQAQGNLNCNTPVSSPVLGLMLYQTGQELRLLQILTLSVFCWIRVCLARHRSRLYNRLYA